MTVDREIDELFSLQPDRFTAARDRLSRKLAKDGDKEASAAVRRLRKPTLTAWALNELSRRFRKDLIALIEAGGALRAAQRKAASGMKDSGFQSATEERRRAIQRLKANGLQILAEAGKASQAAEADIARTLEAASVDDEAGQQLLVGRLSKPIATVPGFDSVTGFEVIDGGREENAVVEKAERTAAEAAARNAERQARKAQADAQRARLRADTLAEESRELARRAEEARREAERLEDEAAAAQKKHRDARGKLER